MAPEIVPTYDPPLVPPNVVFGRGDPPEDEWPGRRVTPEDVALSCGDPRDWFTYEMRLQAYYDSWERYEDARKRRRNFHRGFPFAQAMIIGDLGAKKTVLGDWHGYVKGFQFGHPFFGNAGNLFGWRLEDEEIFTSLGRLPSCAYLAIDEAAATLASRLASSVAVSTFAVLANNNRKRNCRTLIMSAQDRYIARQIREMCSEVWRPFTPEIETEGADPWGNAIEPHNNPANFVVAWEQWKNFPYRQGDIIDGPSDVKGWGKPERTDLTCGEGVRQAFLLTDSFAPMDVGQALLADRNKIKDQIREQRDGTANDSGGGLNDREVAVLDYLDSLDEYHVLGDDPPTHIQAGEIAAATGLAVPIVGQVVKKLFAGIENIQRKGYPMDRIRDGIQDYVMQEEAD